MSNDANLTSTSARFRLLPPHPHPPLICPQLATPLSGQKCLWKKQYFNFKLSGAKRNCCHENLSTPGWGGEDWETPGDVRGSSKSSPRRIWRLGGDNLLSQQVKTAFPFLWHPCKKTSDYGNERFFKKAILKQGCCKKCGNQTKQEEGGLQVRKFWEISRSISLSLQEEIFSEISGEIFSKIWGEICWS